MDGDMFHHTSGEQEAFVCGLCGELGASALHKYWTCPRRNTLPDEDECISKSQWLKTEAEKGFQEHPCLWVRAVLPHSFWHVSDPPIDASEVAWRIVGDMQGTVAASGEAFSDDAGAISGYRCPACKGWYHTRLRALQHLEYSSPACRAQLQAGLLPELPADVVDAAAALDQSYACQCRNRL